MFLVGRKSYVVDRTSFRAYVGLGKRGWKVRWDIEISASTERSEIVQTAVLRSHDLRVELPAPHALSGVSVGPLIFGEDDEPPFLLTTYEHDALEDVTFSFGERVGSAFQFSLRALVPRWEDEGDLEADRPGDHDVVALDLLLPFEGVYVDEYTPAGARERLDAVFGNRRWSVPAVDGTMHVFRPVA